MHLDLIESLRCPHGHDDGWLVAIPTMVRARVMWSGEIGCPTCHAEWTVDAGTLDLSRAPTRSEASSQKEMRDHTAVPSDAAGTVPDVDDNAAEALRSAALLNLTSPGGVVLLAGAHARHAAALRDLVPDLLVLALNAPDGDAAPHGQLRADAPLPLGVGTLRGARLDATHASAAWLTSVERAVAKGGRLIAPAHAALPVDMSEIARDEREWVAEIHVAASGLVPLRRGGDPLTR
ncbi:MAG: hypothetical protein MUD17_01280 [Gemmatimonadaceae bacterium]|nr:hypothetical protein [Gemmatimonadaceae bacterium]